MTKFVRIIIISIIGLLSGLACWPFVEFFINYQTFFPSYLIFSLTIGTIIGVIMGAFFSCIDYITIEKKEKFFSNILLGKIIGGIGGILGFLFAQYILFILGERLLRTQVSFDYFIMPFTKAFSWSIFGAFIGAVDGIRSKSLKKFGIGLLGGILGGFFGGLLLEYLLIIFPRSIYSRLIGLSVLGFFIGFFLSLIEDKFSRGILKLLNGVFKGREYLLNQKRVQIGKAKDNDIVLKDFAIMNDYHAVLECKKNSIFIKNLSKDHPVKVNDEIIDQYELRHEDVIKIGSAKFLFKYR